jgi:hypothetical protein
LTSSFELLAVHFAEDDHQIGEPTVGDHIFSPFSTKLPSGCRVRVRAPSASIRSGFAQPVGADHSAGQLR